MTEEQIALAKRAVACRGWRWMPGMLIHTGFRMVWVDETTFRSFEERGNEMYGSTDCLLPDLTDPATLGCLLALVREAHAVPFLQVSVKISREHGYQFDCHPHHRGQWVDSEAEALVAALEAAP
jgi:hypothetical protein